MGQDYLGNEVTGASPAALRAIDDFIEGYLAYESRVELVVAAADAEPNVCLANVYAGMLWMLLEAPEASSRAEKYVQAAERTAPAATAREQLNVDMLRAWAHDDMRSALALCDRISDDYPRDLVIVKMHQYFEFNRGNAPAMLRVALKVQAANQDNPYVHGMAAFAYEQCHLLEEADSEARAALSMRRKEPWAQHALAHVLLTRGHIEEGAAFLEAMADTWTDLNSFMLTHIWWHLALFYLSQGRNAEALQVYDEHCWGVSNDYSQDQIGAISLLARFDLVGIDVGGRWQAVAEHLVVRAHDTVQPFLTLQYLYGLAKAARPEADTLMDAVRAFVRKAPSFSREVWSEVALPACEGLLAHARGDYDRAWHGLGTALPRMTEVGGSHAQRDLFEQILLDAAIRSGRLSSAQQMLEVRRGAESDSVPVNAALASVYSHLGLESLAAQARTRADRVRARHGKPVQAR